MLSKGISEISRGGPPAAPLHLLPLLRRAPEVSGLLGSPEGPALDFPEALLALGLSQRHKASFEGVPHRHRVAQHALGSYHKTPHGGEHTARRARRLGGLRGGGLFRRACSEAVVPETESPDPAHGVGPVIDGSLQAIQPVGRGEPGVDVCPAEHRTLEIGRIRWG